MQTLNDDADARPSSTVVLVKEGIGEPEIFMVRRHAASSFGAAFAFPGGVVESEDSRTHDYCSGLAAIDANAHLGVEQDGLDYYSAAIRELFEEAGVLLADVSILDESLESIRDGLNDGLIDWGEFVKQSKLQLHCDQLHYFSHWVTPPQMQLRYSTRFFLAVMPGDQVARHCGRELTESRWATANEVLASARSREMDVHFPTIKTLESIARHKTLGDLTEWAASSVRWGVTSMMPILIRRNGRQVVVLPGEIDYPGTTV